MELNFKQNLRAELDYLDLTVKELSVKTGIPKGTLDCYLGARTSIPPADIAVRIAQALGVSVEYLVTGGENYREKPSSTLNPELRRLLKSIERLAKRDQHIVIDTALHLSEAMTPVHAKSSQP
jgi:transcriptional regulator with XRE-family HTH domain